MTTMKDDMISRQAALNCVYGTSPNKIKGRIAELPSATDTNVVGNLIDRQAALDALGERPVVWSDNDDYTLGERNQYDMDRLAIETVPSAQPGCEDAVSRADVDILIEEAQTAWLRGDILLMYPALKKGLQKVPPVTPKQPGWIPVTERLPKPNEYENDVRKYYLVQNEYGDMMVCSWNGRYWEQMYCNTPVEDKVVAWMSLPTPYREGGQDEQN